MIWNIEDLTEPGLYCSIILAIYKNKTSPLKILFVCSQVKEGRVVKWAIRFLKKREKNPSEVRYTFMNKLCICKTNTKMRCVEKTPPQNDLKVRCRTNTEVRCKTRPFYRKTNTDRCDGHTLAHKLKSMAIEQKTTGIQTKPSKKVMAHFYWQWDIY